MADLEIPRDPRWDKVFAVKRPYPHFHDGNVEKARNCEHCTYIEYYVEVWPGNGFFFQRQIIDSVDFTEANVDVEVDKWIWQEMIGLLDERMDKAGVRQV